MKTQNDIMYLINDLFFVGYLEKDTIKNLIVLEIY